MSKCLFSKVFLVGVIIFLFAPFLQANAIENRGAFEITKFDVGIFVKKDASIDVKETIDVTFSQDRHGIFRKIPVRYTDDNGFAYKMKVGKISVLDGTGKTIDFKKYNEGSDFVLQIGNQDLEIIGDIQYVINYTVQRGMRFFDDHDEIYWNPIGVGWPTPIYNATSTVYLEKEIENAKENSICFTGGFGSNEQACSVTAFNGREIEFKANKTLNAYEGLTVAVNLPKGLVSEPTKKDYFLMFLLDNWAFSIPIVVFFGMFYLWYFKGKELDLRRAEVVQYGPPDNLTPGEVGYLLKEKYSNEFVAADIVNLAVKGYLTIREVEFEIPEVLKNIRKVFSKVSVVVAIIILTFSISFIPMLLKGDKEGVFIVPVFIFLGVASLIIFANIKKQFTKSTKSELVDYEIENLKDWAKAEDLTVHEKKLLKGLFANKILGKIKLSEKKKFYLHAQKASIEIGKQIGRKNYFEKRRLNSKVFYAVDGILFGFAMFMIGIVAQRLDFVFSAILTAILLISFGAIMSKKTKKGANAYWHAMGYEHYIDVAQKYRAKFNEEENIFEKTLPYAMIFGNVDKWAKAFEGITKESPSWYHSSASLSSFHATTFANSLNNGFAKATKSASTSPSSSSSGGSSGGGGGGGGGGSW